MRLLVLVLVALAKCVATYEGQKIGGILYEDAVDMKAAFAVSAEKYNLEYSIKEVSQRGDILQITKYVCELAEEGVVGIIDGIGGRASENIQALCDLMELPHVVVQHNDWYTKSWFMLNMYPSPESYNMVLEEMVKLKDWNNFTLLYVRGHSLMSMTNLMMMGNHSETYTVSVRELGGKDYRDVLINAKKNGYVNFVVDCPSKYLEQLLKHAQQVGLMADEHSYIIMSPDLFTLDLSRYRYGGVNMTGFRLLDLTFNEMLWEFTDSLNNNTGNEALAEEIRTNVMLIHDALLVFNASLKKVNVTSSKLSCGDSNAWEHGSSLLNFMRTNKIEGLTRTLAFDGFGRRTDVKFDILELTSAGNQTVGLCISNSLVMDRPYSPTSDIDQESILRNKTLRVLIALTKPFAYIVNSPHQLEGNDRYEGFAIDLIEKLSEKLGFNYNFDEESDYGSYDPVKGWSGMSLQIIEEKADLAICDLTITAERQTGIDFSTPFMTLGIGILYKQPSKQPPEMFSFMAVFSKEVWYYMLLIQLGLGIIMIFVGRISHREWTNINPCVEQPEELTNQFSFANSVWLIIGSVMQQGSEIAPIALAPRMITSVWWFFTMIMVASYVGTLVAFLTVEKNVMPFENVQELYDRQNIPYGAKKKGSTRQFFEKATDPTYQKMYQKMSSKGWLLENNDIGVDMTENSSWAFFMESSSIEYYKERHCDLLQVGGLLDSKSYGIGMKKKSPYKKYIDEALLQLKEQGVIQKLKDLWWKEKRGGGKCGEKSNEEQKQLGMKNMLGAFVVLGVGSFIGLFVSILDMLWGVFKRSVKYNTTFRYELVEELKFALKFSGDVKPVKRPQKTIEENAQVLAETEGKDEVRSLRSIKSGRSTASRRTCTSHSSRHSKHSLSPLSIAFAKRRQYSNTEIISNIPDHEHFKTISNSNNKTTDIMIMFLFYVCLKLCLFQVRGDKTIGGVFDNVGFLQEAALNVAIATVSADQENKFTAKVILTPPGDLVEAEDAVCSLFENTVFGVFGPRSKQLIKHVQNIVDYLEVPHIVIDPIESQTTNWSIINLYPHHLAYSQVFRDIIEIKSWTEFTIIYEGTELLPFLDNILTMQDLESGDHIVINVVQLPDGDDFRPQLKTIKASGSLNYLVICKNDKMPEFLEQAQQIGIMSDEHSYLIMNPDFQTFQTDNYKHGGSNITGIRFFDPSTDDIQTFIKLANEKVAELTEGQVTNAIVDNALTLDIALLHDAVILFTAAVDALGIEEGANVTCDTDDSWNFGSSIVNMMKSLEIDGLTGRVRFDEEGFRSNFEIDIIELQTHGFENVATWSTEDGYEDTRIVIPPVELAGSDSMKGKHFVILTALSAPYGMLKESTNKLEGNDRYEGFGIELIEELAIMNEFNYTFEIQEDGVYGKYNPDTGSWTGMMEKVMDGRVDFAITDLTITSARQKAVDFTSPFMNLGISILYKKPTKQPPDLFSFISPFSLEVWQYLAGAYVGVSVLLFVLGRMAPDEWQNPYPCIEEPETLDNQFSMANSFWFTLGSVLTQGSEIAPIAVSTRMAGSMWWFFTLIMVSSYTANLAAFLTVESKFYAIKSVTDLASNPYSITYGAKKNGATLSFFQESDNLLYQKMAKYMEDHPELMPSTNDAGLERVKSDDENYAFLMESTSIEYMVERNCDVAQVGGLLDSKGYGIAMKKNSQYRQPMSESILQMQEDGRLTRMKNKWWKEKRGGGVCADDDAGSGDAQPLVLANVGGVFIVLAAGSGLAVVCAFLEMTIDVWLISRKFEISFKDEMIAELKFIFTSSGDVKPVRHREPSGSGSGGSKKDNREENPEDPEALGFERINEDTLDPAPTPRSERSTHSHHTLHSRRQSNAVQMAKMRKFSNRSARL
ncbi:uncharacterized protein LOC128672163 [Plodia interpunctella]|uniref:uncharacterized protein LOC128672163 n=1 Tax=Plodia interpunctella TaxID=58824 RepID=UPI002368C783|nr:uncharacterized protein LOC128672163 [Plodia interpunctella]